MPDVWGLLPKAQDEAQTINEAIDEAIAAHEADPEAHQGEGESLQNHKSDEVIDHPANSVVGDKFDGLSGVDGHFTLGSLQGDIDEGVTFQTATDAGVTPGIDNFGCLALITPYALETDDYLDLTFIVHLSAPGGETITYRAVGFGYYEDDNLYGIFLEKLNNGQLRLRHRESGEGVITSDLIETTSSSVGKARFIWDKTNNVFLAYWNGALIRTIDISDTDLYISYGAFGSALMIYKRSSGTTAGACYMEKLTARFRIADY